MTSKVEIISEALNLLGLPPISSVADFPGNNPAWNAANKWYDRLLLTILGDGQPWRFAMVSKRLNVLTTAPPTDEWTYMLQIPTSPNKILSYRVYDGITDIKKYAIYEDKILADQNVIYMDYTFKPVPDKFPEHFTLLLIYELAAHLAMTITQKESLLTIWSKAARGQTLKARAIDSKQNPSELMPAGDLYAAHFF